MQPNYLISDTLPGFEEDDAAISALMFKISKQAPIHQICYYKKDIRFDKELLKQDGTLLASSKNLGDSSKKKEAELWFYKNVYIYIRVYSGSPNVDVVFVNNEDDNGKSVKDVFDEFEQFSKPVESTKKNVVKLKFWSSASYGPKYDTKFLELPTWDEINTNYAKESHNSIQNLMNLDPSSIGSGGKIILLHGPSGTGKTTLIRALIREWQEWCDAEYIIDPEVILNSSNYLTQVVMGKDEYGEDEDEFLNTFFNNDKSTESKVKSKSKFRLLIFEDTEELIASDDKGSVSPSVSRLLNIGDGLLGQGLKVLILITTNVKLEKLHPALRRPGRTLANIHVPQLTSDEASEWLGSSHKEATLAELYEEKNKQQIVAEKKEWNGPTGAYL